MNGLIGQFCLPMFDEFAAAHQATNTLADEALTAFEYFLPTLNEFFDYCDDLTKEIVMNNTQIY